MRSSHRSGRRQIACNRATADFLLSSPLMERGDERRLRERADVPREMEVG